MPVTNCDNKDVSWNHANIVRMIVSYPNLPQWRKLETMYYAAPEYWNVI